MYAHYLLPKNRRHRQSVEGREIGRELSGWSKRDINDVRTN